MPESKVLTDEEVIQTVGGALLMAEAGRVIQTIDCAAFSVVMFQPPDGVDDEWKQRGAEAVMKFARFGWSVFHALEGLAVDWDKMAGNVAKRLKEGFPKKPKAGK